MRGTLASGARLPAWPNSRVAALQGRRRVREERTILLLVLVVRAANTIKRFYIVHLDTAWGKGSYYITRALADAW